MELKELKKTQEDLRKMVKICPFDIKSGNILAVDSAYLLKEREVISTAVIYNIDENEVIERTHFKKKFPFPTYPDFYHSER